MLKKILLAYDGSECADEAARYAKELAKKFASTITVVYAFHPIPKGWAPALAAQARDAEFTQGTACISAVVDRLKAEGVRAEGEVLEGMPADTILQVARVRKSDLIVLGSRGWGQATAFLLGSVSDRVTHGAPCPVLVVK